MSSVTLPADLKAWAEAEVSAGRAQSVDRLVADALRERQHWDEFRRTLDEAERGGTSRAADVFADLKSRYPAG